MADALADLDQVFGPDPEWSTFEATMADGWDADGGDPAMTWRAEVCSRLPGAARSLVVTLAAFFATSWAAPTLLGPVAEHTDPNPVDRLYAEHNCGSTEGPSRTILLISTPAGGAELIPAATTADQLGAQTDWLYDQQADFYGWCER